MKKLIKSIFEEKQYSHKEIEEDFESMLNGYLNCNKVIIVKTTIKTLIT